MQTKQIKKAVAGKTEASKTPKAPKAAKEKVPSAPEAVSQVTTKPAAEAAPKPVSSLKSEVVLLPESERRELRAKNAARYNEIRKALKNGVSDKEASKLKAELAVINRVYRDQRLVESAKR
jgi:hypothetical protein